MKRLLFIFLVAICSMTAVAQDVQSSDVRRFNVPQDTNVPFRLFPTQNMWTFLKLDTRTGQIWGVSYYIGVDNWYKHAFSFDVAGAIIPIADKENIGRFTLYPTANNFNFILLDQFNGETWQVQYDFDSSKRLENKILPEEEVINYIPVEDRNKKIKIYRTTTDGEHTNKLVP